MNIHEYQAKQLLTRCGVAVPLEIPVFNLNEVRAGRNGGGEKQWTEGAKKFHARKLPRAAVVF